MMHFTITGISQIKLSYEKGAPKSKHVATHIRLEVSDNLDKKQYLDSKERPTKEGSRALTQALVQGLIGNIHNAHQKGWRDSAEHLRYVIQELEKGFVQVADVKDGTMDQ
jgi:hypothetical protein